MSLSDRAIVFALRAALVSFATVAFAIWAAPILVPERWRS